MLRRCCVSPKHVPAAVAWLLCGPRRVAGEGWQPAQRIVPSSVTGVSRRAVDAGERCVMYDRIQGVLPEPIGEGSHLRIPWLQSPNIMDIRTRPRTISSVTGTKGEPAPALRLLDPGCRHCLARPCAHLKRGPGAGLRASSARPVTRPAAPRRPADGQHLAARAVQA